MVQLSTFQFALVVSSLSLAGCGGTHASVSQPQPRQIAITLDDAPVQRFYSHPSPWHREQVVDSIALALQAHEAPYTVFAIGNLVEAEGGEVLLRRWLDHGADVANHSWTHPNFNDLKLEEGREEITRTNTLLRPIAADYGKSVQYFRFPFLAEGATAQQKSRWQDVLDEASLTNAVVTISNQDWKYDAEYTEAELAEDWARRYEVGQAYLEHMKTSVAYWDSVATGLAGRHVRHVLLLHANRINRDYLDDLLAWLDGEGFTFISLDDAYEDPLYREPDTWASPNGSSFLDNVEQSRLQAER